MTIDQRPGNGMKKISLVILTYNSFRFIAECLKSIRAQGEENCEIIVVDNGSKDATLSFIKEKYPEITLVDNRENAGAARGRNQGIEIARGEWILTLDCDVILGEGFLSSLAQEAGNVTADTGAVQPKIMNMDRKTVYSCGIRLSWLKRFHDIGRNMPDAGRFDAPRDIFGACSAAALYRKEMLLDIRDQNGFFDERFFFLAEDVDLACRARMKGWKAVFSPSAVCYHHGNSSVSSKAFRQYLCWRNRRLMLEKIKLHKIQSILIFLAYDLPRLCVIFPGNPYIRKAIFERSAQ